MAGIRRLRKLQFGQEALNALGTPVAATTVWRGTGTIEDLQEVVEVEEDVGYIGGTDRTDIPKKYAKITLESTPATFEQIIHLFDMGIKNVAGVRDGGSGSGYAYAYPAPTTAINTIRPRTIEGGDDYAAERIEYGVAEKIAFDFTPGQSVKVSGDIFARQATANPFTGALTPPVVEDILSSKGTLFIDAVTGTVGTTPITSTLLGGSLEIITGWKPHWSDDTGQLYFAFHEMDKPIITAKLIFKHNVNAANRKTDWRAQTPRLFRLQFAGSNLSTPGSYTTKLFRLNFAAKVLKASKLGELDGNDVVEFDVSSRFNSTGNLYFDALVVNELSAVP